LELAWQSFLQSYLVYYILGLSGNSRNHTTNHTTQMSTSTVNGFYTTFLAGITEIMETNIPEILLVLGGLIALGWLVSKARKYIAGKKF